VQDGCYFIVGLVFIDRSQVNNREIGQTQRLRPCAVDLNDRKIDHLAHSVVNTVIFWEETWQFFARVEHNRGVLLIKAS
jgi:hypothetical protein